MWPAFNAENLSVCRGVLAFYLHIVAPFICYSLLFFMLHSRLGGRVLCWCMEKIYIESSTDHTACVNTKHTHPLCMYVVRINL